MSAVIAIAVGAAFLLLFAVFFIGVRRIERDVDYTSFGGDQHNDKLRLLARVVANVVVSSP